MESRHAGDRKKVVRRAIHELMNELASFPSEPQFCKTCGEKMRYMETTFFLHGTERAWNVAVPTCACAAEKSHPALPSAPLVNRIAS